MTTETIDRAEVFSRPSARFDADGNIEVRASSALGCRRALWYAATELRADQPAYGRIADGDGGGQRPGAGGGAGDGAGGLEGGRPRSPGPAPGDRAHRSEPAGHGTPRRHGADVGGGRRSGPAAALPLRGGDGCPRLRRPDGRRDQDAGTGGVQALADAGRGAQPPGVGGPGRLLLARRVRRPAGRGDRHDGHGGSHLGLGADTGQAAGAGLAGRLRVAGRAGRPLRPKRAGPRRAAGAGLLRN